MKHLPLRIKPTLELPADELLVTFSRSGGPGGQNVNKVESKVELRWSPATSRVLDERQRARVLAAWKDKLTEAGEYLIRASEHREQGRNLEAARARLATQLRSALAEPKVRRATKPTKGSQRRRLTDKKVRGEIKRLRRDGSD
jgi:ribosome-associated protein